MIIGETYAGRLTSFDIDADKQLGNRKVWAKMMQLGTTLALDLHWRLYIEY